MYIRAPQRQLPMSECITMKEMDCPIEKCKEAAKAEGERRNRGHDLATERISVDQLIYKNA